MMAQEFQKKKKETKEGDSFKTAVLAETATSHGRSGKGGKGIKTSVHLHTCTTERENLVRFTPDCRKKGTQLYRAEIVKTGGVLVFNFDS